MSPRLLVTVLCLLVAGVCFYVTGLSVITILFAVIGATGLLIEAVR